MFKYLVVILLIVWGVLLMQGKAPSFGSGSSMGSKDYSGAPPSGNWSGQYQTDFASGGGQGSGGGIDGMRQNAREWLVNARDNIQDGVQELAQKIRNTMHR